MTGLTPHQIERLLTPLQRSRITKLRDTKFTHLEAWDVRRHLTRIFGFTGWDFTVMETELVFQNISSNRGTVVFRVTGRLTVKDTDGSELGHWDDGATGDGPNLPVADAFDLALKTAMSQALKRCAVNLGDQFGLSLYNKGATDPVVIGSLAYVEQAAEVPADDAPVEPEAAAPAPADPTDWGWVDEMHALIADAASPDRLQELAGNVRAKAGQGILGEDARQQLLQHFSARRRELFSRARPQGAPPAAAEPLADDHWDGPPPGHDVTEGQFKMLGRLYSELDLHDRDARLRLINGMLPEGRTITSGNDLTRQEAIHVINELSIRADAYRQAVAEQGAPA
jgi:Rad52/22 family double-strand break repair protein